VARLGGIHDLKHGVVQPAADSTACVCVPCP
jgi:hypothetical protein